ncbi:hypothetical protein RP20_CCG024451 [Aedes albopictus]|nr:hypothetical protein RP20_CCG024451 [Aedes albopictus]
MTNATWPPGVRRLTHRYMNNPVQVYDGNLEEDKYMRLALEDIKSGDVRVLIGTNVASQGLDIEGISHVVNYDFPRTIGEYVHRVERTGRACQSGVSLNF